MSHPARSLGRGVELRTLSSEPDLARHASAIFDLPSNTASPTRIFVCPHTALHPIVCDVGPQRCLMDGRAFSEPMIFRSNVRGVLVYKGSDLMSANALSGYGAYLTVGVFPGSMTHESAISAFESGCLLQRECVRRFGTFGPTLIPISVREILAVEHEGEQMGVREYIDRTAPRDIFARNPRTRSYAGTPGEYLFDKRGVRPCQFLYAIEGSQIKVSEMHELTSDPEAALQRRLASALLPDVSPHSVVRYAYIHLAQAYGYSEALDLEDIGVPDGSPSQTVAELKNALRRSGLADHLLDIFLRRTAEIAALGHSLRQSFCDREILYNGCLHPTNTTVSGAVVDLDNVHPERWYSLSNPFYRKDLDELRQTAIAFARIVGDRPVDQIAAESEKLYRKAISSY